MKTSWQAQPTRGLQMRWNRVIALTLKYIATSVKTCTAGVQQALTQISAPTACSLVVQYPRFSLPPEISMLTAGEFQSMVRSSSPQATGQRVSWLVMFHADWCSASHNIQPMFGALARRYASAYNGCLILNVARRKTVR